jgi:gliding motility-associated-like protein
MLAGDSLISYTPNPDYVGSDTFEYLICDYFQHCAQTSVLVLVNDIPFFIPDAFSPNGDGLNDQFEIDGVAKYSSISIEIFNRWGNVVYQSNNYGKGNGKDGFWDGNSTSGLLIGSGPVPSGTYYYIIKLNGHDKMSGAVYLER